MFIILKYNLTDVIIRLNSKNVNTGKIAMAINISIIKKASIKISNTYNMLTIFLR